MELREKLQQVKELKLSKLSTIENDLGIPNNTLTMFMKGKRGISEKFKEPLSERLDLLLNGQIIPKKVENDINVLLMPNKVLSDVISPINEIPAIIKYDIVPEKEEPKIVEEEVVVRKEHTKKVVDSVGVYATMLNEFKYLVEDSCSNDKFERLKFKAINSDGLLPTQKSGIVDRVNNYLNGTYKK